MVQGLRFEPRLARLLWGVLGGALLGVPVSLVVPGLAGRVAFVAAAALAGGAFAAFVWDVGLRRSAALGAGWGALLGAGSALADLRLLPLLATWGALLGAALAKALNVFEDAVERRLIRAEMVTAEAPRARWGIARRRPSP